GMDSDSGHPGRPRVVAPLASTRLKTPPPRPSPHRDPFGPRGLQRETPEPSLVLLGKWFISGRGSVEGGPCCKQRLLYEVTVCRLKAIQAYPFQGSYQLGQGRAKLPFVLAHRHARV